MSERFACGYVLTFTDGGETEEMVLHIGTREECERALALTAAIAYSGGRPGAEAHPIIVAYPEEEAGKEPT